MNIIFDLTVLYNFSKNYFFQIIIFYIIINEKYII